MSKPLLTDEMIKRAAREKAQLEQEIAQAKLEDTQLIRTFAAEKAKLDKNLVYKSRRIEVQKREARSRKMTKYIVILIILLVIVTVIVFNF